jgi:hypothetical protein
MILIALPFVDARALAFPAVAHASARKAVEGLR